MTAEEIVANIDAHPLHLAEICDYLPDVLLTTPKDEAEKTLDLLADPKRFGDIPLPSALYAVTTLVLQGIAYNCKTDMFYRQLYYKGLGYIIINSNRFTEETIQKICSNIRTVKSMSDLQLLNKIFSNVQDLGIFYLKVVSHAKETPNSIFTQWYNERMMEL